MLPKIYRRNLAMLKKYSNDFDRITDEEERAGIKEFRKKFSHKFFDPVRLSGDKFLMNIQMGMQFAKKSLAKGSQEVAEDEGRFIKAASRGPIMACNEGATIQNCFQYDLNSSHGYILSRKDFLIPHKQGKTQNLQKIDKSKVGIYLLNIEEKPNKFCFRAHDKIGTFAGHYTHHDIEMLDLLNIKYELDTTEDFNSCVWETDECMTGEELFGEYLEELYAVKQETTGHAKDLCKFLISTLYGHMVKFDEKDICMSKLHKYDMSKVKQINWEEETFTLLGSPFNYHLGRMKPFVYSYSRLLMGKIAIQLWEQKYTVEKINTDCIVTNAPQKVMNSIWEIGTELGQFKLEKTFDGKWKIKNLHKFEQLSAKKEAKELQSI